MFKAADVFLLFIAATRTKTFLQNILEDLLLPLNEWRGGKDPPPYLPSFSAGNGVISDSPADGGLIQHLFPADRGWGDVTQWPATVSLHSSGLLIAPSSSNDRKPSWRLEDLMWRQTSQLLCSLRWHHNQTNVCNCCPVSSSWRSQMLIPFWLPLSSVSLFWFVCFKYFYSKHSLIYSYRFNRVCMLPYLFFLQHNNMQTLNK